MISIKHKSLRFIFAFFSLFLLSSALIQAAHVTNIDTGHTYHTLQRAINKANDGDTLKLKGKFVGNFNNESKSLTFFAHDEYAELDGNQTGSVFTITGTSETTVSFEKIIFTNGNSTSRGGGILNDVNATVNLKHVRVERNLANGAGGGIFSNGILTVKNSKIKHNNITLSFNAFGGGIATNSNQAVTNIEHSEIENNTAFAAGGLGFDAGSTANLYHVKVEGNKTLNFSSFDGAGGGIFVLNSVVNINRSKINRNSAAGNGGGIITNISLGSTATLTISHSEIEENEAVNGDGGGIFNVEGASLILKDTEVEHNTPDDINDA